MKNIDYKTTQNIINGKFGLKVDNKRVFKNKFDFINTEGLRYQNNGFPFAMVYDGHGYFELYDYKENKVINSNDPNLTLHTYKTYSERIGGGWITFSSFILKRKDDEVLYLRGEAYNVPKDFSRISDIKYSSLKKEIFVGIDKNNNYKFLGDYTTKDISRYNFQIDLSNADKLNPYYYILASGERDRNSHYVGELSIEHIKKSLDNYFVPLINSAKSDKERNNLKQEIINCTKGIEENFKLKAIDCQKRINAYKKEYKETEKNIERLQALNENGIYKSQNKVYDLKSELDYLNYKIRFEQSFIEVSKQIETLNLEKNNEKKEINDNDMNGEKERTKNVQDRRKI